MSDDSFFREVNEEMRQAQAKALWDKYGPWIIGLAISIVLGTAAYVYYQHWTSTRANRSGDAFSHALVLANEGKSEEALAALTALEADGYGAYPVLARLRAATIKVEKGDFTGGIAAFDSVADDNSVQMAIRDIARLRSALLLVDHGSWEDVARRAEPLSADTNPLRHLAREALGLASWKSNRKQDALGFFEQIAGDEAAPRDARQRAGMMAELIRGSGS